MFRTATPAQTDDSESREQMAEPRECEGVSSRTDSIGWQPFLAGLMNGPSKCSPRTVHPCCPPWDGMCWGTNDLYTSFDDVMIVGQNAVTPSSSTLRATVCNPPKPTTLVVSACQIA
jgi:hypothetical protein